MAVFDRRGWQRQRKTLTFIMTTMRRWRYVTAKICHHSLVSASLLRSFPLTILSFMVTSQFEYFNSMLINKVDSARNPLPLGGEFPLEENEHFNKLPVSTQMSNIQVPTNVYNRGTPSETKRTELSYVREHTILFLFL